MEIFLSCWLSVGKFLQNEANTHRILPKVAKFIHILALNNLAGVKKVKLLPFLPCRERERVKAKEREVASEI